MSDTTTAKAVAMESPCQIDPQELFDVLLGTQDLVEALAEKLEQVLAKLEEQEEAIDELAEEIQEALYNDKFDPDNA